MSDPDRIEHRFYSFGKTEIGQPPFNENKVYEHYEVSFNSDGNPAAYRFAHFMTGENANRWWKLREKTDEILVKALEDAV